MKLPKEQPAYLENNLLGSNFDSAKRGHVPEARTSGSRAKEYSLHAPKAKQI
jgi:hypothetical protein